MSLLVVQGQRYLNLGEIPQPNGNAHPVISPYGTFQTADGPINLAPATSAMWVKLCELLDLSELPADPRFLTNTERMANSVVLKELLESRLAARGRAEWTRILVDNGIPAGPINDMKDVFADAQVAAAGIVERIVHPLLGQISMVGSPVHFSEAPDHHTVRTAPPELGEHSVSVLHAFGFAADEISALCEAGIVGTCDPAGADSRKAAP
jgi:crotonobetainyl-CoA:carnitine CoA-transferase CaiB-like acyl-CoA transferase